ncbi:GNAT family N-acetyltransferase [Rufibacter sp. LB8]|uniref:GNAT family N-acetyltransferase n=1 Tax=Rufibacter sp. LB8 TaxID=2777781 RepID=UPI00178C7E5C|nr:GNAT family N-acetyltransferase [Rufibacter sp. LB8]
MTISAHKIENQQDLEAAFKIRETVFVVEQNVPAEEEYDEFEKSSTHYLATANGIPCGTARWRVTDKGVKLERFAVLQEYRSQQVGSAILQKVMADVQAAHPGKKMYMHAQVHAIPFYGRHGFTKVGELFSECDIDHYKMEKYA